MSQHIPHRTGTALVAAALTAMLTACGPDTGVSRLLPDIATAPETLDFGAVRVGDEGALVVQVVNAGRGPLGVTGVGFSDDVGAYTVSPTALDIEAESSAEVIVTFEPTDFVAYDTALVLASTDPETPLVTIPVSGSGIDGGPDLDLDTDALDFGTVEVGASSSRVFTISNVGDEALEISTTSQQQGSGAFALLSDPRGEIIPAGATFPVLVSYTPVSADGDQGSFALMSNDPDEPQVDVSFIGNGGGTTEYPVAIIAATTEAEPGDTIILDGTGSWDPGDNTPLTYSWSLLEAPEASAAVLSSLALSAPSLTLDTAGSYTVALQVENTVGVPSATAVHTVAAVPEQDIYVVLSWDRDDADLDLHLIDSDSSLVFDGRADCCWCNKTPDWGTAGDSDDDPVLSMDADGDGGPESILLADPADGEYFVRVHYYQDDGDGRTEATVRIYLEGELVDQYRRELTHNQLWDVAYVRWPQGYVIEENADPYSSELRSCRY